MKGVIESVIAIRDCMIDLGFHPSYAPFYYTSAEIYNLTCESLGIVLIKFNSNWYSGDGPFIEVNDLITNYNISVTAFMPKFQNIRYNSMQKQLAIIGKEHHLELSFDKEKWHRY